MTYVSTKTYGHEVGLSATFRQWRASSHCRLLVQDVALLLAVGVFNARQVFITGGELAPHDLRPLTTLLITSSFSVQLETSGIIAIQVHPCTWVTVNQRSAMPGGLTVLDEALTLANEFKRPSTSQSISTNC